MRLPKYERYKVSETWLRKIPSDWAVLRLMQVTSINDDVLGESTNLDYEIEYVDIGSVSLDKGIEKTEQFKFSDAPSRARRLVRNGDILVSTVRTYLRAIAPVVNPPENLVASTGFAVIRPSPKLFSGFVKYALQANGFIDEVISRSTGVSYPAINASDLGRIYVPLPPTSDQTAIAAFLDRETAKIDTLIAEQEKLLTLLAEKRQATISHAVTKGLNPDVPMKDSGVEWLGEVPEHWVVKRLKHISPFITVGIVVNPSDYVSEEGLPFLYGGDITEGAISIESCRRISEEDSKQQPKTMLNAGDLLTVRVGAPGITAVVPESCEGGNCASVMLIRRGNFKSDWLCYVMNSRMVRHQVEIVQYGAAQEQFNISHAINFWIATPPKVEQAEIAEFLDLEIGRIRALTYESENAIALLKERRSALISAAVTGQIDVRNAVPETTTA